MITRARQNKRLLPGKDNDNKTKNVVYTSAITLRKRRGAVGTATVMESRERFHHHQSDGILFWIENGYINPDRGGTQLFRHSHFPLPNVGAQRRGVDVPNESCSFCLSLSLVGRAGYRYALLILLLRDISPPVTLSALCQY